MKDDHAFNIATAPRRNSLHWKQGTITWGEIREWMDTPGNVKESGDYVLGLLRETAATHKDRDGNPEPCTGLHRRKDAIVSRSALCLDIDYPATDLFDRIELIFTGAAIVHTTFGSSPDEPRYRMIVPTDRGMAPDEYIAAAKTLMARLGEEQFDPGSSEPERYMFMPAAQEPLWFEWYEIEGEPVAVDGLLKGFQKDLSKVPVPTAGKKKRDPFGMAGAVGAFNRAYEDIQYLVDTYDLPYVPAGDNRWHLIGAQSVAGLGIVDDGIVYSHHTSDPAFGTAWTAFDLVRLHRFLDLDEDTPLETPINRLPSHEAMLQLASKDPLVTAELVGLDFAQEMDDEVTAGDWRLKLRYSPRTGKMVDDIHNWDRIVENMPVFQGLYFNEFSLQVESDQDLPWRPLSRGGKTFNGVDRIALTHLLEREFQIRPVKMFIDGLLDAAAQRRYKNPVRDRLDALVWDGTPRLETSLPGVVPTEYSRLVARKCLAAAVARIFEPGCKWDHSLILYGKEGIGKSYWIDKMSLGYEASLGKIGDKDTLLAMQRSWIMVSDEGHSLRKTESDIQKEFLTRRSDIFRLPYERESNEHPRHCVIWGTTNDETFLRRQEGNRRFLIVHCEDHVDFEALTPHYIDQVWAEAVHLYRAGETLYLDSTHSAMAAREREAFTEEDALEGILARYLETLVPEDWPGMSIEARQHWLTNREDDIVAVGEEQIVATCTAQIWCEALGRRFGEHKRSDLLQITESLYRLGWKKGGRGQVPGYGPQNLFTRPEPEDLI